MQDPAELEGFACAALPAESNTAEVLVFEKGYMAALAGVKGIIVYDETGAWQIHDPQEDLGNHAPDPDDAPGGLFAPTGAWRDVWRQPNVFDLLGWAVDADTLEFDVTQQQFPGGFVVAEPMSGDVFKIPIP